MQENYTGFNNYKACAGILFNFIKQDTSICHCLSSGYSQSASLLAYNLIAAIAAFQRELVLPLKQVSPYPPLMFSQHRSGG